MKFHTLGYISNFNKVSKSMGSVVRMSGFKPLLYIMSCITLVEWPNLPSLLRLERGGEYRILLELFEFWICTFLQRAWITAQLTVSSWQGHGLMFTDVILFCLNEWQSESLGHLRTNLEGNSALSLTSWGILGQSHGLCEFQLPWEAGLSQIWNTDLGKQSQDILRTGWAKTRSTANLNPSASLRSCD